MSDEQRTKKAARVQWAKESQRIIGTDPEPSDPLWRVAAKSAKRAGLYAGSTYVGDIITSARKTLCPRVPPSNEAVLRDVADRAARQMKEAV